jgi:hypothetical protein
MSDDNREWDYGSEESVYNDDDVWRDAPEQEFGVGYHHMEHVGRPEYEDEYGIGLRTEIVGGTIGEIQRKIELIGGDPLEKFVTELDILLRSRELTDIGLDDNNKQDMRSGVDNLTFIGTKNPLLYILGYFLHDLLPTTDNGRLSYNLRAKLDIINTILLSNARQGRVSEPPIIANRMLADVIKYARFWQINRAFII